jgi:hypothetical protein
MDKIFQQTIHVPGVLAADLDFTFSPYCDMQLIHISAVSSSDSDALLAMEDEENNAILDFTTIGDSGVPKEITWKDFYNGQPYTARKDNDVYLTLDYDGDSGTAAADVTIILTYTGG